MTLTKTSDQAPEQGSANVPAARELTTFRTLSVSVKVPEGADLGEIIERARSLGEVTNLSFSEYQQFAGGYDLY
jgi:hypothetical protein